MPIPAKRRQVSLILFIIGAFCLGTAMFFAPGILPFHVSGAILCYAFFLLCVVSNILIGLGKKVTPEVAVTSCNAGLFFAAETLITGAMWARQAWGAVWVWEPRLTGMLLMTLFFISWRLACAIVGPSIVGKGRLTASLIILGLPSMAFTHLAVRLFGGIHPETVAQSGALPSSPGLMTAVVIGHLSIGLALWLFGYTSAAASLPD